MIVTLIPLQTLFMKTLSNEWSNITRKYLGHSWVRNEKAVMNLLIKQQSMQPLSVEQARAQVLRLKNQSHTAVKKGHATTKTVRSIEEAAVM
jgi:hypothetical protein